MISGSGGYLVIGGTKIPVASFSLEVRPSPPSGWLRMPPGSFNLSMTWEVTWDLKSAIADLESRRWSDYLTRQFRGRPGIRFADLMRGMGRN
jgi:hypothetical protein